MLVLYPGRIGIRRCWFSWRKENQRSWRKTLEARSEPTNFTTYSNGPESNPDHIVEGRAVITGPSLLPKISLTLQNLSRVPKNYLCLVMANFYGKWPFPQPSNQLIYPPTYWRDEKQMLWDHTWVKYFPLGERTFMDRSRINLIKSHKEPTRKCNNTIVRNSQENKDLGSGFEKW